MSKKINNKLKSIIIDHINNDSWNSIMELIRSGTFNDLNLVIENGNTLYHLACIKGKTSVIKEMIKLKKEGNLKLNTGLLNGDGLPGIHLYYKYGGNDVSFLDEDDVCYIDDVSRTLAIYLSDRIDTLEKLIDKMFEKGCIDNTELLNDYHIYHALIKSMMKSEKENSFEDNNVERYISIIKKLYLELESVSLVFIAIDLNSIDVIKMLMGINFDFTVYSKEGFSPLARAIHMGYFEIAVMILEYTQLKHGTSSHRARSSDNYEVYKMIHASEKNYDYRPIFVTIEVEHYDFIDVLISYMMPYIKDFQEKNKLQIIFSEIDNEHNTYLHELLLSKDLENISLETIQFFIEHTNLNQENYFGTTCSHLLVSTGIWKNNKDILENREIDLLKIDNIGNNCYSYVKQEDKQEFLQFTQTIKLPLQFKDANDVSKIFKTDVIKSMISYEDSNKNISSKNYGLFNSNLVHYMLYLRYIESKFKNLYVPTQEYSDSKKATDIFIHGMTSYNVSIKQLLLNKMVNYYLDWFYSYLPHDIYWIDEQQYFVHPELIDILKAHDSQVSSNIQRYIVLKLTIIVTEDLLHANVLIYDRFSKEAWRFEPYGITDAVEKTNIDNELHNILKEIYGEITYHDPNDYLMGLNFQLVDGEEYVQNKNLGDPGGYCLAWCIWFLDVVLSNPNENIRDIMRNFFSRYSINTILSEEEGEGQSIESTNYYLDFIRRYARKLDDEKNKILLSIGIKKYYLYNITIKDDIFNKIMPLFKIIKSNNECLN
jgi:hypothetical protein